MVVTVRILSSGGVTRIEESRSLFERNDDKWQNRVRLQLSGSFSLVMIFLRWHVNQVRNVTERQIRTVSDICAA
jgi:hypothetical protein